jgi:hypothetical protein
VRVALVLEARVGVKDDEHDRPSPMHPAGDRIARQSVRLAVENSGQLVAEGVQGTFSGSGSGSLGGSAHCPHQPPKWQAAQ